MGNGLGCRLLLSVYQDFGFLPGEGHADPTHFKSCSCVPSQTVISGWHCYSNCKATVLIWHRLNKQRKTYLMKDFLFGKELPFFGKNLLCFTQLWHQYLPILWHPSTDTESKPRGAYCLQMSNYYWQIGKKNHNSNEISSNSPPTTGL